MLKNNIAESDEWLAGYRMTPRGALAGKRQVVEFLSDGGRFS
jgi:hypothetical protein